MTLVFELHDFLPPIPETTTAVVEETATRVPICHLEEPLSPCQDV